MIDRDDISRAARDTDALAEEIGLETVIKRYDIDLGGLTYVAEQRAMRMCLIMEGRLAELNPSRPTPVKLGWTQPMFGAFQACWVDAFISGRISQHDDSRDIAGIDTRADVERVVDLALRVLATDAASGWLDESGVAAEWLSDAAADLWRSRHPDDEQPDTFTLEGIAKSLPQED